MALYESQSINSGDYANNVLVGGGVGGDINITNIVVKGNLSLMPDLLALYTPIYNWHTNSERKRWVESYFGEAFFQSSFASKYFNYVQTLKQLDDPSIGVMDIMNTAYAVITGELAWLAMAKSEGQSLLSYSYQIILCIHDNSVDIFGKTQNENKRTRLVEQKIQTKYPKLTANKVHNVGGDVFLQETNRQFSAHAVIPPQLLGFKKIETTTALVNQILEDKIKIHEVILHKNGKLWIDFEVENLTGEPIEFLIPKGQVFENLEYKCQTQNLASTQEHCFRLAPFAMKSFSLEGWCLNRFFAYPDGGKGRITIYETIDKSIQSQAEQWQRMDEKVKIVQENYPSWIPPAPPQPKLKETIIPQTVALPNEVSSHLEALQQNIASGFERGIKGLLNSLKWIGSLLFSGIQNIASGFEKHTKGLLNVLKWIGFLLFLWMMYSQIVYLVF